jgi:hypothetical protein
VVYVCGWFPVRGSLDWAILGGLYLPLAIGCAEAYLQSDRWRYALGLSVSLGLQLFGGHFQIAFFTWLLLGVYGALRLSGFLRAGACHPGLVFDEEKTAERTEDRGGSPRLSKKSVVLTSAFVLGVMLAAVQLSATWELKTRSQRATVGGEHLPFYGHLPPLYLTQLVAPWSWYDPAIDLDTALHRLPWSVPAATNRAEAHLYFGLIPLALIVVGVTLQLRRRQLDRWTITWLLILIAAVVYATGWPLMILQSVPGFNFFRGPARSGIVATLAAGLLAGRYFDWLRESFGALAPSPRPSPPKRGRGGESGERSGIARFLAPLLFWLTLFDLWWTPQGVTYAIAVARPPIRQREVSVVRQLLQKEEQQPPRLFAPGQNLPNLLGVSAVPVYLGLGPQEYFDPQFAAPKVEPDEFHTYSPERVAWLRAGGVTHILSFERLEPRGWPVEHVWSGFDPLLNPAWARFQEPVHLYRLNDARGRVFWENSESGGIAEVTSYGPHHVHVQASSPRGGRLILTELAYPGWELAVNGEAVRPAPVEGMFRAVDLPAGKHEVIWSYRPWSVYWGAAVTGLAALILAGLTCASMRRRPDSARPG